MNSPLISYYSFPHTPQAVIHDFFLNRGDNYKSVNNDVEEIKYFAYNEPHLKIFQPKYCAFEFMTENELQEFVKIGDETGIKKKIEAKMDKEYPKGVPRDIFISLMLNVRKFCEKAEFDVERTGVLLSVFYFTHIYTRSKFDLLPDKVFSYFKELIFCHTLPFPPNKRKIFTQKETKSILEFFFKIYLRNLPLLRLLCLPNFAFSLQYDEKTEDEIDEEEEEKVEKRSEVKIEKKKQKPEKKLKPDKEKSDKKKKGDKKSKNSKSKSPAKKKKK